MNNSSSPSFTPSMSAEEIKEWRIVRPGVLASLGESEESRILEDVATKAKVSKPIAEKLGRALLAAAVQGNSKVALAMLAQGANPNLRVNGLTPMDIALKSNMDEVALAILSAGGWAGPSRYSNESVDFTAAAKNGFSEDLMASCKERTMSGFECYSKSWSSLLTARDTCAPTKSDALLMCSQCEVWHFEQVSEAVKMGLKMDEKCWSGVTNRWSNRWGNPGLLIDEPSVKSLRVLMSDSAQNKTMPAAVAEAFFANAVAGDDVLTLVALLDGGLCPGPKWTIPVDSREATKASLLVVAAISNARAVYEVLKLLPLSRKYTGGVSDGPDVLALIPIARLLDLSDSGLISITRTGAAGRGIAHYWAKLDDKPRDGWASLATRAPEVFGLKDEQGKTGAERMGEKLIGKARDDFFSSLSRIESREIRKEIGSPPKLATTKLSKRRL